MAITAVAASKAARSPLPVISVTGERFHGNNCRGCIKGDTASSLCRASVP